MCKQLLLILIGFYRTYISPLKQPCCRFVPSCSEYSIQAIEKYGAIKGVIMSIRRILRCHPFNPGGYDPV